MKSDNSSGTNGILNLRAGLVALAVAMLAMTAVAGTVGMAAAQTTETATDSTTTTSESTELADKTVSVNNDTQEVYITVNNTSGDAVDYTLYGVSDGLSTEVSSGQISALAGEETTKTFAADPAEYDEYRFVVEQDSTDSDTETVESVEVGKLVQQSASGGALFGGSGGLLSPLNLIIGVLLLGVLYLVGLFDPLKQRISEMQG